MRASSPKAAHAENNYATWVPERSCNITALGSACTSHLAVVNVAHRTQLVSVWHALKPCGAASCKAHAADASNCQAAGAQSLQPPLSGRRRDC